MPKTEEERKEYNRNRAKRLRLKNPDKFRKRSRDFYAKNRLRILAEAKVKDDMDREKCFEILGGKCVVCGIDDKDILEFDHIIPIRNRKKRRSDYSYILKHPKEHQIMCANHHKKKSVLEQREHFKRKTK